MDEEYHHAIAHTARILDAWLPHKIQYDRIPGLSVGIVHSGRPVYQRGFGFADIESKTPATARTCYRIASISKTFTAVAVMQLVEQGKIGLDDRVRAYLPWFKPRTNTGDAGRITIRQLLSHTAGVIRDGNSPHWVTDEFPDAAGLRKSMSDATMVFENLTRFKYSNFGFALAGEVIQKASGVPYHAYVGTHIIRKLGMTRTAPDLSGPARAWLATGYSRPVPHTERERFPHAETRAYAPAAGFLSNVPDLSRYLSALTLTRRDGSLVDKDSKKEMLREHWATGEENEWYGLGFHISKVERRKIVGHGGGFAGFSTRIALDIDNDIGVVALTNTNDPAVGLLTAGIFETIYKLVDEKNRYGAGARIPDQERYEGAYRNRWGDVVVVGIDTNLVALDPRATSPVKTGALLKARGRDRFVMEPRSNTDSPGELARFLFDPKRRKARAVVWGSTPLDRLDE